MRSAIAHVRAPLLLLMLSPAAASQTLFLAELDGAQETPPVATAGSGTGQVILDPFTSMISIEVSVSGLTTPIVAAHIHTGAVGVAGGVTIPLAGPGPTWTQTSGPLTSGQLANLQGGRWYFNVHTTSFGNGEVRGQITTARSRFDAYATGAKEVPANASPGLGVGEFTLTPAGAIQYSVSSTGLATSVVAAHLHEGAVGVGGPVIFPLTSSGPTSFAGTTGVLTPVQVAKLRAGLYYLNIHTVAFGAGEIRGQVVPSFTDYGTGCPGTTGTPALDGTGTPVPGGAFTLDVSSGLASGGGVLMFGVSAAETPLGACTLLVQTVPVLIAVPMTLDPGGNASLPLTLAATTPTAWLQLQFAGLDIGAAGGVFSLSNGLGLNVNN